MQGGPRRAGAQKSVEGRLVGGCATGGTGATMVERRARERRDEGLFDATKAVRRPGATMGERCYAIPVH